jgi:hypothetical protein
MQARLTERPQHEVIAAIQALDLESVKLRVMDPELGEGWTREYADSIEAAYKTYLTMLVKYEDDAEDILLSEDVDEFWHGHILHTRKYAEDCQKIFGAFLHHNPQVGGRAAADLEKRALLGEKTRRLYEKEFGSEEAAYKAWAGAPNGITRPAYGDATSSPAQSAYCDASMQVRHAAYCDAAVAARKPAYCDATASVRTAAYCDAAVSVRNPASGHRKTSASKPAYCDGSIAAHKLSYCDATVSATKATYCDATVSPGKMAYCDATVSGRNAAYCDGIVSEQKAAYCDASVGDKHAMR